MGQPIYVQVEANVANGIMTMDASGGGEQGGGYWLDWDLNSGFTNGLLGWDSLKTEIVNTGWPTFSGTVEPFGAYDGSYESFMKYLQDKKPDQLNSVLGDASWSTKGDFVTANWTKLTDGTNRPGNGCVRF